MISDRFGTPQQIVDSTGTVAWKVAYFPFGKVQILTEIITNNIRFPGQYFDTETGLHYNWNRYYDPDTGRYLTPDPIGLAGGLNLYAYVGGDPVNEVDPMGLLLDSVAYEALMAETTGVTSAAGKGSRFGPIGAAVAVAGAILGPKPAGEGSDQIPLPGDEFINPDGTIDDSAGVDNDCDKKGKWLCEGYSSYDQAGTSKHVRKGSTWIIAYGKTETLARNAWIKKAQNAAPRGFTARHIRPRCKKIK